MLPFLTSVSAVLQPSESELQRFRLSAIAAGHAFKQQTAVSEAQAAQVSVHGQHGADCQPMAEIKQYWLRPPSGDHAAGSGIMLEAGASHADYVDQALGAGKSKRGE